MSSQNPYSEDALVEKPAIELFKDLGWQYKFCQYETFGAGGTLGRETNAETVLRSRLLPALRKLNPRLSIEALNLAVEELARDRSLMGMAQANRECYGLLKNGVKVTLADPATQEERQEIVRVLDWDTPANNDFLLTSQLWIMGEMYKRRADLIGFVNGLPLVFVELKATHKSVKDAYTGNLTDYRHVIPQLFWYNAVVILSNGDKSLLGSLTSKWEHFAEWKRIDSEGTQGVVSLETILRGVCDPTRLLDLVENFTLFTDVPGGVAKILAKNHQYLGVNQAIASYQQAQNNGGRVGVFWHTQGSGKSYSMIFFAQKILRKVQGSATFLVVTDRKELDTQIYKSFINAGAITRQEAQVTSGDMLRLKLREDHRYLFTLIQKFRTENGETFPLLSERDNIIVIADEAHRSQYDTFALNMRRALPNAAYIGFTGTPLMAGEERTRQIFGEYVSVYNFRESVEDGATVPLYYENRIPELQLVNDDLNDDMERLLEEAEVDEEQERKLEREFAREYHLLTRDDRLEKVAEDLVAHFIGRGQQGKAMVISIDKVTAVKMYDKVQKYWQAMLDGLRALVPTLSGDAADEIAERIAYMEKLDMAVVVSASQNEAEEMQQKGVDIVPHRKRMVKEDLEAKFKDADNPLSLVFVCAMWITGFDVPSCSTIYLDKPMKNHTLMQTIARANRVFPEKTNGLIVDYVGVFRNLQRALAIYGSAAGGGVAQGDAPIEAKAELVDKLLDSIAETTLFLSERGVDVEQIQAAPALQRLQLIKQAIEAILENDVTKRRFKALAGEVGALYKAVLPDPAAGEMQGICTLIRALADKIKSLTPPADITAIMSGVESLLDYSVAADAYVIRETGEEYGTAVVDLSQLDIEALQAHFDTAQKRTEAEKLKHLLQHKIQQMVRKNRTRLDYLEKFQSMIDEYNADSSNVEAYVQGLIAFTQQLSDEEQRHLAEKLEEEELAIFDLLTRPAVPLGDAEREQVKAVARDLLATLKQEKLVLDWRKKQQARAAVQVTVSSLLDKLPAVYTTELYQSKCELVYQHIFESYHGQGQSVYAAGG